VTTTTSAFDLPDRLSAKATPAAIFADDQHFSAIAESLKATISDLSERLDAERSAPGRSGQQALERDLEIHRLTTRLRTLRRYSVDLCLGRMVDAETGAALYVGRLGLTDSAGRRLLIDWRSPAAEPFFGATHANPMGLASRRRYRWTRGRVSDYWDEVFSPGALTDTGGLATTAALDDQSAFIASLGASRSPRMRDVLATIQADQNAIIRAGSRGALVIDGGPGTGKTVVALHRAAYLLYSDPRLGRGSGSGGILFVGPHEPYLAYISDVLPSLGEDGVHTATIRDLVLEGAGARDETDPTAARLKASGRLVTAITTAVHLYESPPSSGVTVETPWADVWLSADDWADAFDARDAGTPHNDAREEVWDELVAIITDRLDDDIPAELINRSLRQNAELREYLNNAWPLIDPARFVATLWSDPAFLGRCAPWLMPDEIAALQRARPLDWTLSDLPLLDAARNRIGDPNAARRRQREASAVAQQREQMEQVIDDLIAAEELDDGEGLMTMLRGEDLKHSLIDESVLQTASPDLLAGPFGHILVDEAQELTDAEWLMLLARCPSRSFTIVGDRAQARHGFAPSWRERLERIGLHQVELASLTINYRTPAEVMAEAEPVIRAVMPDANVPTSIRSSGIPVVHGSPADLHAVVDDWLAAHPEGAVCVIGDPGFPSSRRVRSLSPLLAKGLEFDLVVLVDPAAFGTGTGTGTEAAVDRYVAMTRATHQLVILEP
jgi:DNA helicase IV